ncbi:hypothetical protein DPMN_059133 [Dreissena polymorpha]|uniref:Uncharacterized protein n=1 Tax=Dreissena polymorpha TaxID=45954 RepID=A0A9D4C310_DREPO|nr:hypothetical protein DPMN_059133 [Dreissena polymorpha]
MWQISALYQFAPVQSFNAIDHLPMWQMSALHQFAPVQSFNAIDRIPNVADVGTAPVCTSSVF